jgi:hypothetical protein
MSRKRQGVGPLFMDKWLAKKGTLALTGSSRIAIPRAFSRRATNRLVVGKPGLPPALSSSQNEPSTLQLDRLTATDCFITVAGHGRTGDEQQKGNINFLSPEYMHILDTASGRTYSTGCRVC